MHPEIAMRKVITIFFVNNYKNNKVKLLLNKLFFLILNLITDNNVGAILLRVSLCHSREEFVQELVFLCKNNNQE